MPKRLAIPKRLKMAVRYIQDGICGCSEKCREVLPPDGSGLVEYDHTPALKLREIVEGEWVPHQHNPDHIVAMIKAHHRVKTSHPRGKHTSIDSDQHSIAKVRRLTGQNKPRVKRRMPARKMVKSAATWPKRKL